MDEAAKKLAEEVAKNYQAIMEDDFYTVLNLEKGCSDGDVRKAYHKLAKTYHPDVLAGVDDEEIRKQAADIFDKLNKAHQQLSTEEGREAYEDVLSGKAEEEARIMEKANRVMESEVEFQKGQILLKRGDMVGAVAQLRRAVSLSPDEPEYWAYLGWATFKNRKGDQAINQEKGKEYLRKALKLRSDCEVAHFYFAYILKIEGESDKAEEAFRTVLKINPENEQAKKEVSAFEVQRKKEAGQQKKKGGLSGFLNKMKGGD